MKVVGITHNYTMSVPLNILKLLAADFDGDTLNIHYIINEDFREACSRILSPRNAMMVSRNDGYLNIDLIPTRDLIINGNTLMNLCRSSYSKEQLEKIRRIKERQTA